MQRANVTAFTIAAVVGAGAIYPMPAQATFRTFPAIGCLMDSESTNNGAGVPTILANLDPNKGQVINNSTSSNMFLDCPVTNDSSLPVNAVPAGQTETLTVSGWANSLNNVKVQACRTFFAGSGGQCGAEADTTAANNVYHLTPSLSAWTSGATNDSYYVHVVLGQKTSTPSVIWTYQVTQQ